MEGRFERGDHLRVRRPTLYNHHGIYVSDERVIQFGGSVRDKRHANIEAVSMAEFERQGTAVLVKHPYQDPFGWLPGADEPDLIVERAEWLLVHHPPGRYHLIGRNCELAANWCVAEFTESLQSRKLFLGLAFAEGAVLLTIARSSRRARGLSGRETLGVLALTLAGVVAPAVYNGHIRRFWNEIGMQWRRDGRSGRRDGTPA